MAGWMLRLAAGSMVLVAFGCTSYETWDRTLDGVIRDVNEHLHRSLRNAYAAADLEAVLAHYDASVDSCLIEPDPVRSPPGAVAETARRVDLRTHKREILERFDRVDRATVVLLPPVSFDHPEPGHVVSRVQTRVYGAAEGGFLSVILEGEMEVERRDSGDVAIVREVVREERSTWRSGRTFVDATLAAGITLVHQPAWLKRPSPIVEDVSVGTGAACGDFDGDGFEDLYLVNGKADRLYRNVGGERFEDVTVAAGLGSATRDGMAAAFADLDGDGWRDLVVVNFTLGSQMFRNLGDGTFAEVEAPLGLPAHQSERALCVLDHDGDGDLDLFIAGGGDLYGSVPLPAHRARNGTPDRLYRNDGGFRFTDVTDEAGVGGTGWALAAVAADVDADGDQDLYVANDFGFNALYINRGDGTFSDESLTRGAGDRGAGMSCAVGDYDNDGQLDLFVSNMFSNSRWIQHHPAFPVAIPRWLDWARVIPEVNRRVLLVLDEMSRGNTLLHNRGGGEFADVSDDLVVRQADWAWGSVFFDHDNDGDLDLYVANGMVSGEEPDDL